MIGARWANAEGGGYRRDDPAYMQGDEEMTVTMASKALNVGGRGIQYARIVLSEGTPEEIADYARARRVAWGQSTRQLHSGFFSFRKRVRLLRRRVPLPRSET